MKRQYWIWLLASLSVLVGVGCASGSVNQGKLTDAQSAVRAAQEVGAPGNPDAALHLQLANEEIASAEKLYRDGEKARGDRMLERAQADAELALALAKLEDVREEAREAKQKVDLLKKEGL
jgi:hypothetical protein